LLAVKLNVVPEHIGELFPAVGGDGGGLIVTEVVFTRLTHPFAPVAETE
jgi:hypothetical protein